MPIAQALKNLLRHRSPAGPKVLLVVAHPDDEYAVAATVYRVTHELQGTVDQFTITNGEGGFRYSQLAEAIYGVPLSDEPIGRTHLPAIRREETLQAGKILGVRKHFFLDQGDSHFSTDAAEPLNGLWDRDYVSTRLRKVLQSERYQYVFILLPTPETHGHHQAAALLTAAEVLRLPETDRPVLLGANPAAETGPAAKFQDQEARHSVRRDQPISSNATLTYTIVANWVIAAHKSQGLFQTEAGKHTVEQFWILDNGTPNSAAAASRLFAQLEFVHTPESTNVGAEHATPGIAIA